MTKALVEISGLDYTGKTTQAEMLTHETWHQHAHNFGSFSGYGELLPQGLSGQEHFQWWFADSSFNEFSGALIDAYADRHYQAANAEEVDVAVVERGNLMLKAQIAANFATRSAMDVIDLLDAASEVVDKQLGDTALSIPRSEFLLVPDDDWQKKNQAYLRFARTPSTSNGEFTNTQNDFYEQYMENAARALLILGEAQGAHIVPVDRPAADVQNIIRQHEGLAEIGLPRILTQEPVAIGLAGLSESGKSAVADSLMRNHGFSRIKLGYFNESLRTRDRAYADPARTALNAVHFLATNRHIERLTIESLHGPQLGAQLKLLLGERWQSVFIELSDEARAERLREQYPDADIDELIVDQQQKDARKLASGIQDYRDLADMVIDNSGCLVSTTNKIMDGLTT